MLPDSEATSMGEQDVKSKGCSDGEFMKNKLSFRRSGERKRDRFGAKSREVKLSSSIVNCERRRRIIKRLKTTVRKRAT